MLGRCLHCHCYKCFLTVLRYGKQITVLRGAGAIWHRQGMVLYGIQLILYVLPAAFPTDPFFLFGERAPAKLSAFGTGPLLSHAGLTQTRQQHNVDRWHDHGSARTGNHPARDRS